MNRKWLVVLILLLFVGAVGAGSLLFDFPYNPVTPPVADSNGSTLSGVDQVVDGSNSFAVDLYNLLINNKDNYNQNLFFSPYSVSTAMAIANEGANDNTELKINDLLHFPSKDILRPNTAKIYNNLNNIKSSTVKTGNAIWVNKSFPINNSYKETVERYYGAKAANLDFNNEPIKSKDTINSFIEEQTNGKIENLVKDISPLTELIITNAIYFNGNWKYKFNKRKTEDLDFTTPTGVVKAPMMELTSDDLKNLKEKCTIKYYIDYDSNHIDSDNPQNYNYKALELPYKNDELSMILILPKDKNSSLDFNLTNEMLNKIQTNLKSTSLVTIKIPKFEFKTSYMLDKDFEKVVPGFYNLGFSNISSKDDLYISQIYHDAYISVDEKGTTAAAATAIGMCGTAMIIPKEFIADHPFIFLIKENKTNNILFLGRVVNPS